ncbi:MAG: TauD/TfdA family dioxygenase [Oceanospirillaceae bacterium]
MKINIEKHNNHFKIFLVSDEKTVQLPALWLRERTQDPRQVDTKTAQRLFNPHLLDSHIAITAADLNAEQLHISFSDGHSTEYNIDFLAKQTNCFDGGLPPIIPWVAREQLATSYDWQQLLTNKVLFLQSVNAFLSYGYIILSNTPTESDSILSIATYYGNVRDTNFGRFFEVYSKPNPNDLAYTPYAIGPHTDNPYRDPVPGIQLLHCLKNHTQGGYSTLADGLSIVTKLREEDPEGFKLLTETVVRFRFYDTDTELVSFHPLIEKDTLGNISGIHYSPRLDDLPLLPEEQLQKYQQARKRLGELLADVNFEKKFKLLAGDLMMFDNNRILHGRTEFDPTQGVRHLQGCYIDRDGPKSIQRVANRQYSY